MSYSVAAETGEIYQPSPRPINDDQSEAAKIAIISAESVGR